MREVLIWVHNPAPDTSIDNDEFFIVQMPEGGKGGDWYSQARSVSAFRARELKRTFGAPPPNGEDWLTYARRTKYCTVEYDVDRQLAQLLLTRAEVPTVTSIWKFYEAVGYDRKAKKYIGCPINPFQL